MALARGALALALGAFLLAKGWVRALGATLVSVGLSLGSLVVLVAVSFGFAAFGGLAESPPLLLGIPLMTFALALGVLLRCARSSILAAALCAAAGLAGLLWVGGFVLMQAAWSGAAARGTFSSAGSYARPSTPAGLERQAVRTRTQRSEETRMKPGYTIVSFTGVAQLLSFVEATFGLKRSYPHESGTYGEPEAGETTLSFAAHELGDLNFPGGHVGASDSQQPPGVELCTPVDS